MLVFWGKDDEVTLSISGSLIQESDEKRLVVTLDKTASFKKHFSNLCKKASQKVQALVKL